MNDIKSKYDSKGGISKTITSILIIFLKNRSGKTPIILNQKTCLVTHNIAGAVTVFHNPFKTPLEFEIPYSKYTAEQYNYTTSNVKSMTQKALRACVFSLSRGRGISDANLRLPCKSFNQ